MTILYPYPSQVDKSLFKCKTTDDTKYGLPSEVKFCRSCVISNQRPSSSIEFINDGVKPKRVINFDESGVCDVVCSDYRYETWGCVQVCQVFAMWCVQMSQVCFL